MVCWESLRNYIWYHTHHGGSQDMSLNVFGCRRNLQTEVIVLKVFMLIPTRFSVERLWFTKVVYSLFCFVLFSCYFYIPTFNLLILAVDFFDLGLVILLFSILLLNNFIFRFFFIDNLERGSSYRRREKRWFFFWWFYLLWKV